MAEPGIEDTDRGATSPARPTAASIIAELWSEREQSARGASPPPPPGARRRSPKREGTGSNAGAAVAVILVALLLGGGAGYFLHRQGFGQPSKAAFVRNADAVCGPANGAVTALAKPSSYPDLATAAGALVTSTDAQLAALRKLSAPGGADRDRVRALLSAMTQTNVAGRGLKDAADKADDRATAAAVTQMRAASADASTTAGALGLSTCATGMQPGIDTVAGGATGIVKTAFVAKADTICRAAARDLDAIRAPRDARDVSRFFNQMMPVANKLVADLKALPVPPGDESTVAEAVGGLEKMFAKSQEVRDAAAAGDRSRVNAIDQEASVLSTATSAKLDAYGLTTCGSNFGGR